MGTREEPAGPGVNGPEGERVRQVLVLSAAEEGTHWLQHRAFGVLRDLAAQPDDVLAGAVRAAVAAVDEARSAMLDGTLQDLARSVRAGDGRG